VDKKGKSEALGNLNHARDGFTSASTHLSLLSHLHRMFALCAPPRLSHQFGHVTSGSSFFCLLHLLLHLLLSLPTTSVKAANMNPNGDNQVSPHSSSHSLWALIMANKPSDEAQHAGMIPEQSEAAHHEQASQSLLGNPTEFCKM
jgi:hypothetical protein